MRKLSNQVFLLLMIFLFIILFAVAENAVSGNETGCRAATQAAPGDTDHPIEKTASANFFYLVMLVATLLTSLVLITALYLSRKRLQESFAGLEDRLSEKAMALDDQAAELQKLIDRSRGADQAARESRKQCEMLVENAHDIFLEWSSTRGALSYSRQIELILGYPLVELLEDPFLFIELIHPEDRISVESALKESDEDNPVNEIFRINDANGKWHWFHLRSFQTRTESDGIVITGNIKDITARIEAEEMIRLTLTAVDLAGDEIYWIRPDMTLGFANDQACRFLGYSRDELLKMSITDINPGINREEVTGLFQQAEKNEGVCIETIHRKKSGELYPVEVRINTVEFRGEKYIFKFCRDISQKKKAETRMRFIQTAIDQATDEIFWINPDLGFGYVNEHACRTLGYPREKLMTMKISAIDPFFSEGSREEIWEDLRERKNILVESLHTTRNGKKYPVELSMQHTMIDGKEILFVFARDITVRKLSEEQLKNAFSEIKHLKENVEAENVILRREVRILGHGNVIGESPGIIKIMSQASQVAATDSTVLLMGETGTGKELVARAIHKMSMRKDRPFIAVNCAALPSNLIESELFGHEKGSFTGALSKKTGYFESADRSTIFLDEIGELTLSSQAKLLRILQESELTRVGGTEAVKLDIRVIAATNRDLGEAVKEGRFRADLFFRLNVFPLVLPPLRERKGDIPLLVWHFISEFSDRMGKSIESIPRHSMEEMQGYQWPGNVRELRNVIERAIIRNRGPVLRIRIPKEAEIDTKKIITLDEAQRRHILDALDRTNWRIRGRSGAAAILGMKPSTLESRMTRLGIHRLARIGETLR
ncbi:MAG: sigma 54-interacting transcriptional regulator [Candidatus Krumholzibacteriota bacterium]|nr:sigma 54-interacting transcriptional regulator [Candidatus Krumholzibacteriota bacterium]